MANEELDLTLKLGLPNPTVDTRLSLATLANTDQGTNVGDNNMADEILSLQQRHSGNDIAGASNYVDVNIKVYGYVFTHFAGTGETLNFAPYAMPPSPVTPHVSHPNSSLAMANVAGSSGSGGRNEEGRRCMNRNCNAVNTPLWRRGPLGPKSLCNACGIKFRKEEERRNKRNSD